MSNTIFNPEIKDFRELINYDFYVDKTDKYVCVTMSKNFGKSKMVDMLTTYYTYSQEKSTIFDEKNIAKIYAD
ncbi:hypothetical protein PIROE2DRAFT_5995 [Piromyces sp. E2]|nr:hypothetical protein PIROE2DRAFT_5995 [Piromyces sp. E2]|eukprot:OUM66684.1 hypothetical protein PIROE2DRAFT_5995 [Piromyces sp. E2]